MLNGLTVKQYYGGLNRRFDKNINFKNAIIPADLLLMADNRAWNDKLIAVCRRGY